MVALPYLLLCLLVTTWAEKAPTSPPVKDYQELNYERLKVSSPPNTREVRVVLTFKKRVLPLVIRRRHYVFTGQTVFTLNGKRHYPDLSTLYHGYVESDSGSTVRGSVVDGIFQGKIALSSGQTFTVEKITDPQSSKPSVHSIIYASQDISNGKSEKKAMNEGSRLAVEESVYYQTPEMGDSINNSRLKRQVSIPEDEEKVQNVEGVPAVSGNFTSSADSNLEGDGCPILIISDPLLWAHYKQRLGSDDTAVFSEIVIMLTRLFTDAAAVLRQNQLPSLNIRAIKVNTSADQDSPFSEARSDSLTLLSLLSHEHDISGYCLAYMVTYRNLEAALMGASVQGGVCSKDGKNVGYVTMRNSYQTVQYETLLQALIHHIGHSYGASDDTALDCGAENPYDKGDCLMHHFPSSGTKDNNKIFSNCSRAQMEKVIAGKKKANGSCFKEWKPTCGNDIIEQGEQCEGRSTNWTCCDKNTCQLKSEDGILCDQSQGPCCQTPCTYYTNAQQCVQKTECTRENYCNGTSSTCPKPVSVANETLCNHDTQYCQSGICQGSLCDLIKAEENGKKWIPCFPKPLKNRCYLACTNDPGDPTKCYSTQQPGELPKAFKDWVDQMKQKSTRYSKGIPLPTGTSCKSKVASYCDVFHKCRDYDNEVPLLKISNFLFSHATFRTIKDTVLNEENRPYVISIVVGLVLLSCMLIGCCTVTEPSSEVSAQKEKENIEAIKKRIAAAVKTYIDREDDIKRKLELRQAKEAEQQRKDEERAESVMREEEKVKALKEQINEISAMGSSTPKETASPMAPPQSKSNSGLTKQVEALAGIVTALATVQQPKPAPPPPPQPPQYLPQMSPVPYAGWLQPPPNMWPAYNDMPPTHPSPQQYLGQPYLPYRPSAHRKFNNEYEEVREEDDMPKLRGPSATILTQILPYPMQTNSSNPMFRDEHTYRQIAKPPKGPKEDPYSDEYSYYIRRPLPKLPSEPVYSLAPPLPPRPPTTSRPSRLPAPATMHNTTPPAPVVSAIIQPPTPPPGENAAVPTPGGNTAGPTPGEDIAMPNGENIAVPPLGENTDMRTGGNTAMPTGGNTAVSPRNENTAVPPQGENTAGSPTGENTAVPPPGENIAVPPPGENTAVPPPGENITVPPPGENTAVPPPGEITAVPPPGENPAVSPPGVRTS